MIESQILYEKMAVDLLDDVPSTVNCFLHFVEYIEKMASSLQSNQGRMCIEFWLRIE